MPDDAHEAEREDRIGGYQDMIWIHSKFWRKTMESLWSVIRMNMSRSTWLYGIVKELSGPTRLWSHKQLRKISSEVEACRVLSTCSDASCYKVKSPLMTRNISLHNICDLACKEMSRPAHHMYHRVKLSFSPAVPSVPSLWVRSKCRRRELRWPRNAAHLSTTLQAKGDCIESAMISWESKLDESMILVNFRCL